MDDKDEDKRYGYIRRRARYSGLTFIIMVVSFVLYGLGLFGTVEGPLHPERIGTTLAKMGVTGSHFVVLFALISIIAVTWDRLFNHICLWLGLRLTCRQEVDNGGTRCGAPVVRNRTEESGTEELVCAEGHKRLDAQFHPIQKGLASRVVFLVFLTSSVITFLMLLFYRSTG